MDNIKIITQKISLAELKKIASERFGDLVKAVVDVEKEIMAIGGNMHADEEQILIEQGSRQKNLWGINIYPEIPKNQWIEFDSMINIRPLHNNRTRGVDDPKTQEKIFIIVNKLIKE